MAISDKFARLKSLYTAINDLDNSLSIDDPDIIDTVMNVVKDVPKADYPLVEKQNIIDAIRRSLIVLYAAETKEISQHIGIDFGNYDVTDSVPEDEEYVEAPTVRELRPTSRRASVDDEDHVKEISDSRHVKVMSLDERDEYEQRKRDRKDTRGGYLSNLMSSTDEEDDYYDEEDEEDDYRREQQRKGSDFFSEIMNAGRRRVSDSMPSKIIRDQKA